LKGVQEAWAECGETRLFGS